MLEHNSEFIFTKKLHLLVFVAATVAFPAFPTLSHEGEKHGEQTEAKEISVSGEVVDMVCYIDHNATGPKHADCAQKCIEMGLPVGIKADDGKTYLLIGEHKPINLSWLSSAPRQSPSKARPSPAMAST
jgi:hypothetical protein